MAVGGATWQDARLTGPWKDSAQAPGTAQSSPRAETGVVAKAWMTLPAPCPLHTKASREDLSGISAAAVLAQPADRQARAQGPASY